MIEQNVIGADSPIEHIEQDKFQRNNFAKGIAQIIKSNSSSQSSVIGIYGEWGSGKTSLLKLIRVHLNSDENIIQLYFNPWRFDGEKELLLSFFFTLADSLDASITTKTEKIGGLLKEYSGFLKPISWFVPGVDSDSAASAIGEKLSEVQLETLKQRIEKVLLKEGKKIVIYIDDIDRLNRAEIQTVFKLVKLTGNFAYTNYILAFDDKLVAESLAPMFGNGNTKAGYDFLEKIIQTPLHLPAPQLVDLRDYFIELLNKVMESMDIDVSNEESKRYLQLFWTFQIRLTTPRMAVRYINALGVVLPLLKGEANTVDILLIEGIRIFYPELYALIQQNPFVFLRRRTENVVALDHSEYNAKASKELFDNFLNTSNYTDRERKAIVELSEKLFPMFKEIYKNSMFPDRKMKELKSDLRIASPEHFKRFFSYTVLKGEVPEYLFRDFQKSLETGSQEEIDSKFVELTQMAGDKNILGKLRNIEDRLDNISSEKLAQTMAKNSHLFSGESGFLSSMFLSPNSQLADCIVELSKNIEKTQRVDFYNTLLSVTNPFEFIIEVVLQASPDKDDDESEYILDKQVFHSFLGRVVSEVISKSGDKPFWQTYTDYTAKIFKFWELDAKKDEIQNYVKNYIDENPESAIDLIKTFAPFIQSTRVPHPYRGDLDKEHYNFIGRFIDQEYLYSHLIKLRDVSKTGLAEYVEMGHNQTRENVIEQFMYFYEKHSEVNE
ncbi:P-loop NTPase fold protein [Fluviicola sp.]|uniref:KAP family P-loop NTPase fold protein n=1 Tax=Fluviicola sp. TaxID=1917219 RepID=UPI00261AAA65|nr:P-loop NTPase fold protein [Fluviicola sp.]